MNKGISGMAKHPSSAITAAAPLVFDGFKFVLFNTAWHLHNHLNQLILIKNCFHHNYNLASEVLQCFNNFSLHSLVPLDSAIKDNDHKLGVDVM